MKEDSDQKERCNKKAEGKFGFLRTVSQIQRAKKPKNALYIKGKDVDCPIDSLSTYQIAPIEFDLPEVKLDAIGISCPQALEILDQKGIDKTTPVFCYAHKTYQKAKELGFTNIHTTPSSKQEIVKHILEYFGGNI